MLPRRPVPVPPVTGPTTTADVQALVSRVRGAIRVVLTPMPDVVARLDTTGRVKVVYLDCDSPPEDQCWALREVIRVLALGPAASGAAVPAPRMRLVHPGKQKAPHLAVRGFPGRGRYKD